MRVLVACEFSGIVRDAFIRRGHDALSCDFLPSEKPGPHYQGDVRDIIGQGWDLMVAHPPCQYLTIAGIHWNNRISGRAEKTEEALAFVRLLLEAPIPKIALENPIGVISSRIRRPEQIIQPWQFGHPESKRTALWLKGLPQLTPTNVLKPSQFQKNGCPRWDNQTPTGQNNILPGPERWMERSRTYQGIAEAMADKWGAGHELE